jgi:hypothetical protein
LRRSVSRASVSWGNLSLQFLGIKCRTAHIGGMFVNRHANLGAVDPGDNTGATIIAIGCWRVDYPHPIASYEGSRHTVFLADTRPPLVIAVHDEAPSLAVALGWR